ncbi:MAG: transcriptional regulator, MarR family [Nocardia sp.]|uniref:MarR family winged helix-turn-helix transcriptional regulator n=1 Tax=Nocardia sp. TaxID=1821 RepID=UPI00262A5B07|nr:MarR family transcriptional regulator [Nocardia sp.]MCU1644396.1 transcriptional regulator, MarR family [Nocardia sp.]
MDKSTHLIEFEMMLLGRSRLTARAIRGADRLDRSWYALLYRLIMGGPMSIGQLSDAMGLDTSTVNRQSAAMLRAGLVNRIPDPAGAIARKLRITAEGERRLEADRTDSVRALEDILADWSSEDVAAFAEYLKRFNSDIEQRHGRP